MVKSTLYEIKKVLYNMGNMKMGGMSMNCMKCGRELTGEGVFCAECLAEMDRYPVRPGTVVHLPRHNPDPPAKKPVSRRKSHVAPEEKVKQLRKLVVRLVVALVICTVLLVATGYFAVVHLLETRTVVLPGQNYSAMDSTAPETEK